MEKDGVRILKDCPCGCNSVGEEVGILSGRAGLVRSVESSLKIPLLRRRRAVILPRQQRQKSERARWHQHDPDVEELRTEECT
jgi:hypothetical protein